MGIFSKLFSKPGITSYVVIDFETTGFGGGDEIIEIGAVKVENRKIVDKFGTLINPRKNFGKDVEKNHRHQV